MDIGLGLYDYLKEEDPEAYHTYHPIVRESLLVHKGIIYYGQADNLKHIEFTRSDLIKFKSAFYSFARERMLFCGEGGIYYETNEDAEFTWKSVEKDHGVPYVKKELKSFNIVYTGDLTVNVYGDGTLIYTKTLPNHATKSKEFFRPSSGKRGILMKYELVGKGSVENFVVDVNTLNPT